MDANSVHYEIDILAPGLALKFRAWAGERYPAKIALALRHRTLLARLHCYSSMQILNSRARKRRGIVQPPFAMK